MESTRTITELKSIFIRAQIRILSERIEPPEDWRSYATGNEEDELRDKVVEDVLQKCTVWPSLSLERPAAYGCMNLTYIQTC